MGDTMSRSNKALDYFGQKIASAVRDEAMDIMMNTLSGVDKSVPGRLYARRLATLPEEARKLVEELCLEAIDCTIHHLLWWIEQEQLNEEQHVRVDVIIDGEVVDNIAKESDGLAGEYEGKGGWMGRFSKYPVRK